MSDTGKKRAQKKRAHKEQAGTRGKNNLGKIDAVLKKALDDYLHMLAGHTPRRLHKLVLERVEKTLLDYVLQFTKFNQSRSAKLLGISRSTLRVKIRTHGLASKNPRAARKKG